MSTNNFYFKNMLMTIDCTCEEECQCYEDLKGNIQADLSAELNFAECDEYEHDGLRSYPGKIIAEKDYYHNGEIIRTLSIIIRSGYYAGANVDYTLEVHEDQEGEPYVSKFTDRKVNSDIKKMKAIVTRYTEELRKVGQFSNGEAVYERA